MRHFIAYHNTERMGRSLNEGDPLTLVTNRSVQHLLQNAVWFVQGDGTAPKNYSLASVFVVNEVGETGEEDFKRFARGSGHVFDPLVPLNDLEWFPEFFKALAHFSLGVHEVKEDRFVGELMRLAEEAGYQLVQ